MQRFTNILFICDPLTNALPALQRAVQLARTNEAKLTITNVRDELPRTLLRLQKTFLQLQKDELNSLLKEISTEGLDIKIKPLTGTPFLEIIKEVARNSHDLVIKPTEGHSDISSMLFGSTDLHLMRKCPCPVWIIKPSKQKQFKRILAAVDPDPEEKVNAELNTLILDLASSLAHKDNSELHIVHAWKLTYESSLRNGHARIPKSDVDQMVSDTLENHKRWLDELLTNYDLKDLSSRVHLLKGNPGDIIPALAKKKGVDLIVMGTVARTGIPGFLIGNTAEKILMAADSSILAVKPESFSTPVKS